MSGAGGKSPVVAEKALLAVAKNRGLHSKEFQRMARLHCERGNVVAMIHVVGAALLSKGLFDGSIPQPAGVKTRELTARAVEAIRRAVRDYHEKGGVVTAKRYATPRSIAAEMMSIWDQEFRTIDVTKRLVDEEMSEEVRERLSVAALAARDAFLRRVTEHDEHYELKKSVFEGLCKEVVRAVLTAFDAPNEEVHRLVHGEMP